MRNFNGDPFAGQTFSKRFENGIGDGFAGNRDKFSNQEIGFRVLAKRSGTGVSFPDFHKPRLVICKPIINMEIGNRLAGFKKYYRNEIGLPFAVGSATPNN